MIKIACCQYKIEKLTDWKCYTEKIELLVNYAKQEDSNILLMPEYAGIEIVCNRFNTDHELYKALQPLIPKYIEFYKNLAIAQNIYIQAGTLIEEITPGKYVNRAYFFSPNGSYGFQDKLQLTQFEKSLNILQHGKEQNVFETSFGKVGIAICYDSEFPEIVRNLIRAGANLILVPSYTTTMAGYNRVFLSCRARAIENQCYVAVSYVVGSVDMSAEIENTFGQAAVLGPADNFFPEDGIIVQGKMNECMNIFTYMSFEKIELVRKQGQVLNFEDSKRCFLLSKNNIKI